MECICVESGCVFSSKSRSNGFHNVTFVGAVLLLCEEDVFDGEDFFDGEEDFFDGEEKRFRNCEKIDDEDDDLLLRCMARIGDVHMHPKTPCSTRRLVRGSIFL